MLSKLNAIQQITIYILLLAFINHVQAKKRVPKCKVCKDIVKNFNKGLQDTAKSNFGGGNTKWEEKSLGSYAHSETRLVEIIEKLCNDSEKESLSEFLQVGWCHTMVEEHEEMVETFWFKEFAKKKQTDLHQWLCIDNMKACCPNNTYGRLCRECPGGKNNVCKGNGKCQGEGTREGSGKCKCSTGYKGELCDECKDGYWEESRTDKQTTCKVCHISCKDKCTEGGPLGCEECKAGWSEDDDAGCLDINECSENPCKENQFCTNTQGSYSCFSCDLACGSCHGSGPAQCLECAAGYSRNADTNICADVNECSDDSLCQKDNQECMNLPGSYECACVQGYKMVDENCEPDGSAKSDESQPNEDSENDKKDEL